jgi:hypothetical protein
MVRHGMPQDAQCDQVKVQLRLCNYSCMLHCRHLCCKHRLCVCAHVAVEVQVQPPGFEMRLLPYTDELKFVSASCQQVPPGMLPGLHQVRAGPEAVAAAGALVDALTDSQANIRMFGSPEELFAGQVLRAQVLGTDLPDRGQFSAATDYLERRAATAPVPAAVSESFIGQVCFALFQAVVTYGTAGLWAMKPKLQLFGYLFVYPGGLF